jgi:hypothetical protein
MKGLTSSIVHAVLAMGILLAWSRCPAQGSSQSPSHSITIYMMNGKTGRPMRNKYIRAKFPGSPQRTTIRVDNRGFGHLQIPAGVKAFSLSAPYHGKKHRPAYTVCGPFNDLIPVRDVLAHGYVPLDACSPTLRLRASPGVLLYFAQPLPWYPPSRE